MSVIFLVILLLVVAALGFIGFVLGVWYCIHAVVRICGGPDA